MNEIKVCKKCGEKKPISAFGFLQARKDGTRGRRAECNFCLAIRSAAWRREYPERHISSKRNSRAKHREKRCAEKREWHRKNRFLAALIQSRAVAKRLGYTPCVSAERQIELLFTGKCHVCGVPESECNSRLAMDHDHVTGAFRGWLCSHCNTAAGLLRDSPEIVMSLALYLEHHAAVAAVK